MTDHLLKTLTTDMNPVMLGASERRWSHFNGPLTLFMSSCVLGYIYHFSISEQQPERLINIPQQV